MHILAHHGITESTLDSEIKLIDCGSLLARASDYGVNLWILIEENGVKILVHVESDVIGYDQEIEVTLGIELTPEPWLQNKLDQMPLNSQDSESRALRKALAELD